MRWLIPLIAGCYAPSVQPGSPCSPDGSCPTGLVCSPATGSCELTAIDAFVSHDAFVPHDGAPPVPDATIDAMPDAAMVDAAPQPPPSATLVQQMTNQNTSGETITAGFANKPAIGDLLVMVGANPGKSITSVTGGATWQLLARSNVNVNVEIWVGTATGGQNVTFVASGSDSPNTIWIGELTHATATADVPGTATSGTTSPATAPMLTTTADDLAFFAVGDGVSNTYGTLAGWTAGTQELAGPVTQGVWFTNVKAGTTVTPSVSETSHDWDAALAVVKRQ